MYNEARFAEEEVFLLFTQYFFDKNIYTLIFDKNTRTLRIVWDFSQAKIKMITLCAHTHEKSHFIFFFNKANYEFLDRMLTLHIYFYIVPFYF